MAISNRDRDVLNALREHGDTLTQPHEIVHWAYFLSADSRAQFVEQVLQMGFKLDGTTEPTDKTREFGVRLSHTDIPNEELSSELLLRCRNSPSNAAATTMAGKRK